ncbi:MAG TPA: hypothetical protein VHX86_05670 [Tepidisphaeraceae bacterium]|jgi:hypothetical protein|nr:hypothetical protein [Tepidisphaeraceae bacterium]
MAYISAKTRRKLDDALSQAKSPWRRIFLCGIPGFACGVYGVVKAWNNDSSKSLLWKIGVSVGCVVGSTFLGFVAGAILEFMDRILAKRGDEDGRVRGSTLLYIWISLLILLTAVVISVLIAFFFK